MAEGAAGSIFALTETLTRATPLILTGLAAAVAFRARLYNIGAEGQLYAGALAAVAVGSGAVDGAAGGARPADPRGGGARRRAPHARPGAPEGEARRRRGGHDAAAELCRAALRPDDARRPAEGSDGRRLAAVGADHAMPGCCRRSSNGCGCTPGFLVALAASLSGAGPRIPHSARAEDQSGRREPGRGALCRDRCRRASRRRLL